MADTWASDANKALSLRLIGAPSPADEPFGPDFTYQVGFGQEETVFGYSDLSILLSFSSASLAPLLTVNFGEVNESTTAKIDDIPGILQEFLPPDYETDPIKHKARADEDIFSFKPPGDKVASYHRSNSAAKGKGKRAAPGQGSSSSNTDGGAGHKEFEIYHSNWATPGWRDFHRRMQLFALLFIEGASYIHEDEDNWEWLTTWQKWVDEKGNERWSFVGYTSLYRFWHYPSSSRLRLSQFVILPPYHKQGHGSQLYNQVYTQVLSDASVSELTIEDPNEAFDRLRDTADLKQLLLSGGIIDQMKGEAEGLNAPVEKMRSERWRSKAKIAKRQWSRLIEMIQLLELDPADKQAVKAYRLQVKARIYRFNKDVLTQLELAERQTKLQETFENLLDGEYGDLVGIDVEPLLSDEGIAQGNGSSVFSAILGGASKKQKL
ncbi:unnamed protein product [Sympodiomycopsis kandeliae]